MAADAIVFEFTAQIESLLNGLKEAGGSLDDAFSSMETKIGELSGKFEDSFKQITDGTKNVSTSFGDLGGAMMGAFKFDIITTAISQIEKYAEAIERIAERGTEIKNMAAVLGMTAEQYEALAVGADRAGISTQMLMRSGVRLTDMFQQAQAGSDTATLKLEQMGFTLDQINDKTFGLNDAFQVLHDRLNDTSTATQTQVQLQEAFGSRAALVAQVLKDYDGSAQGVARVMNEVNGLSGTQTEELHKVGAAFKEAGIWIANGTAKLLLYAAAAATASAAAEQEMGPVGNLNDSVKTSAQVAEEAAAKYKELAHSIHDMTVEAQQSNIQFTKDEIASTKTGTAERIQALNDYRNALIAAYGANSAKVKEVDDQILSNSRVLHDEQKRQLDELVSWAATHYAQITELDAREKAKMIAQDEKTEKEQEKQLEKLVNYAQDLDTRVTKEHAKALAELTKADHDALQARLNEWKTVTKSIEGALDNAIKGMLAGTMTFGQAMRSIFMSMLNAVIDKILNDFVNSWIESMVETLIIQKTTATSQTASNAAVAASAAMASVAAIPFVGWAMAPEVGASTYAEAMGYTSLASAAGGWEVPHDTLAMVHKDEKILPANFSKGLDNLIKGNGGAAEMHAHIHVNAIDTQSGLDFIHGNMREIARGLQREMQRFGPALRGR